MPDISVRTRPFDDAPQPQGSYDDASDPWAAFPDWAPPTPAPANGSSPFTIFSGNQPAPANIGDPWAAFSDWPPHPAAFQSWPEATINPANAMPFNPAQASLNNAFWPAETTDSYPAVYSLQAPPPAPMAGFPEPAPVGDLQMSRDGALRRAVAPPAKPNQGVPVQLPNGQNVADEKSPTGYLMSPVADLGSVAAAGKQAGITYSSLVSNPDTTGAALPYLFWRFVADVSQGGTFDYQREGSLIAGYTQLPQFRNISNFNVGLYCQQLGLTLDETLRIAGIYAFFKSSNAKSEKPYGLDQVTKEFIETGFNIGERGLFDQPPAP